MLPTIRISSRCSLQRFPGSSLAFVNNQGRPLSSSSSSEKDVGKHTEIVPEEVYRRRRLPPVPISLEPPKPVESKLLKRIPVEFHGVEPDIFNDETIWMPIYRYPHVNRLRRIIKFKVYLTACSTVAVAERCYSLLTGAGVNTLTTLGMSVVSLAGLILAGNLVRRLICQVYTSPDVDYIRMCRFSFFGRRIDIVLPRDLVLPLTETNTSGLSNMLTKVKTVHPQKIDLKYDFIEFYDEEFFIPLRYGTILDKDRFSYAFGYTILERKIGGA